MWPNHYDTDRSRQCTASELFHCAVILTVISFVSSGIKVENLFNRRTHDSLQLTSLAQPAG